MSGDDLRMWKDDAPPPKRPASRFVRRAALARLRGNWLLVGALGLVLLLGLDQWRRYSADTALPAPGGSVSVPTTGRANLAGDVFVVMKSGDVKRGADVEVALIRGGPEFDADWTSLLDAYSKELAQANAALTAARSSQQAATEAYLAEIRAGRFGTSSPSSDRALDAARRVDEVRDQYRQRGTALLLRRVLRTVRTDANGHYELNGVPEGPHYLFSQHQVFDNSLRWVVPVTLAVGLQKLDLSNSNAGSPL